MYLVITTGRERLPHFRYLATIKKGTLNKMGFWPLMRPYNKIGMA